MIVQDVCAICHEKGSVIDTILICTNCILKAMYSPTISNETKRGLKWICNMQYGALVSPFEHPTKDRMSAPVKTLDLSRDYPNIAKRLNDDEKQHKPFSASSVSSSDRGFKQVHMMTDLYGATVRVVESSLATEPAVWIFVEGGGVNDNHGSIHMNFSHIDDIIKALKWIKKNHYQKEKN